MDPSPLLKITWVQKLLTLLKQTSCFLPVNSKLPRLIMIHLSSISGSEAAEQTSVGQSLKSFVGKPPNLISTTSSTYSLESPHCKHSDLDQEILATAPLLELFEVLLSQLADCPCWSTLVDVLEHWQKSPWSYSSRSLNFLRWTALPTLGHSGRQNREDSLASAGPVTDLIRIARTHKCD